MWMLWFEYSHLYIIYTLNWKVRFWLWHIYARWYERQVSRAHEWYDMSAKLVEHKCTVMLRWLCDWYITNRLITVVPSQTRFLFQLVHGKSLQCHCRSDIQCRIDFQMCIIWKWNNGIWLVEREPASRGRGPCRACARAFEMFRITCLAVPLSCVSHHMMMNLVGRSAPLNWQLTSWWSRSLFVSQLLTCLYIRGTCTCRAIINA